MAELEVKRERKEKARTIYKRSMKISTSKTGIGAWQEKTGKSLEERKM